jgi:hypothetical protein
MLLAIERAKTSKDWTKDGGQYIPYPATWLRAKGWEDDFPEESVQDGQRKKPESPNPFDKPDFKRVFSLDRAGNKIDIATGAIIEWARPPSKETPEQIQAAIKEGPNREVPI